MENIKNVRMLVPEITVPVPGHILRSDINVFGETIPDMRRMRRPAIQVIKYPRNA